MPYFSPTNNNSSSPHSRRTPPNNIGSQSLNPINHLGDLFSPSTSPNPADEEDLSDSNEISDWNVTTTEDEPPSFEYSTELEEANHLQTWNEANLPDNHANLEMLLSLLNLNQNTSFENLMNDVPEEDHEDEIHNDRVITSIAEADEGEQTPQEMSLESIFEILDLCSQGTSNNYELETQEDVSSNSRRESFDSLDLEAHQISLLKNAEDNDLRENWVDKRAESEVSAADSIRFKTEMSCINTFLATFRMINEPHSETNQLFCEFLNLAELYYCSAFRRIEFCRFYASQYSDEATLRTLSDSNISSLAQFKHKLHEIEIDLIHLESELNDNTYAGRFLPFHSIYATLVDPIELNADGEEP